MIRGAETDKWTWTPSDKSTALGTRKRGVIAVMIAFTLTGALAGRLSVSSPELDKDPRPEQVAQPAVMSSVANRRESNTRAISSTTEPVLLNHDSTGGEARHEGGASSRQRHAVGADRRAHAAVTKTDHNPTSAGAMSVNATPKRAQIRSQSEPRGARNPTISTSRNYQQLREQVLTR